jgi:hypothetical protein
MSEGATYHYGLALVLDDMARSADLVPPAEAEELELVSWVDGLVDVCGCQCGSFPLGGHDVRSRYGCVCHRMRRRESWMLVKRKPS